MPVERREVSVSQFAELMGIEPERLIAVERKGSTMVLILEPDDDTDQRNLSATEGQHDSTPAT